MVTKIELRGYDEFKSYADALDSKGPKAIFYFTGSKMSNGMSWCPDCIDAEPIVRNFMNQVKKDVIFGIVEVGDSKTWADYSCPFRTDPNLSLLVIPAIVVWKGVQRLEGSQCVQTDLLLMLLEDEEP